MQSNPVSEVVQLKPKKTIRVKFEQINATHIVDVWRLFEQSIRETVYPDMTQEKPDAIRSHLFNGLQQPSFFGLMAKSGRRPIGLIMSHVLMRPFGHPNQYGSIWCVWVDPAFRKQGVGKQLYYDYMAQLNKNGVHHWEAATPEGIANQFIEWSGKKQTDSKLLLIIGGRT